ncbi:LysR substrate-binding domain-containing protein, partial [Microbispora rosea]
SIGPARSPYSSIHDSAASAHSLLDLVGNGLGVALVPRSFSAKTARVRFLELADPVPMWETVAVSGAPGGAAAAALLDKIHHASH